MGSLPRERGRVGVGAVEGQAAGPLGKEGRRYPERPIVGVLAVVMRGDRALVVRRANPPMSGRWGFPGGVLELGETSRRAPCGNCSRRPPSRRNPPVR